MEAVSIFPEPMTTDVAHRTVGRRVAQTVRFAPTVDMIVSHITKNDGWALFDMTNARRVWPYNLWGRHEGEIVL